MHHATALLYHVCAVASRNIRFASCGTSGKLTLWTRYVFDNMGGYIYTVVNLRIFIRMSGISVYQNVSINIKLMETESVIQECNILLANSCCFF
jgi:hypothetical protein